MTNNPNPPEDEELDRILINLYLGENTTEKMPNWQAQMKNPELAEAKQALQAYCERREVVLQNEYTAKQRRAILTLAKRTILNDDGCLIWRGPVNNRGYGILKFDNGKFKTDKAHRVAYYLYMGDIPDRLTVDHLCKVKNCVNPEHMELVTKEENLHRGSKPLELVDYCPNGHKYDDKNTVMRKDHITRKPFRICLACKRISDANYKARKRARILQPNRDGKEQ